MNGTIKTLRADKGFGFIAGDGAQDISFITPPSLVRKWKTFVRAKAFSSMWDRDLRGPARRTSGAPSYWPAGTFPECRPEERLHSSACLPEGGCHRSESHVRSRSSVDLEISAKLACW